MTVYVDDMRRPAAVGKFRARWSHLFADTHDELVVFAATLGLNPSYIQHAGTHREHFDLTDSRRSEALALGAVAITYPHGTAAVLDGKRTAAQSPTPPITSEEQAMSESAENGGVDQRLTPEVIAALRKENNEAGKHGWKGEIGVDDVALLLDAADALLLADDICSDVFCHHPRSDHGHIGCHLCDCTAMNNEGA